MNFKKYFTPVIFFISAVALAQPGDYKFAHVDINRGLSNNQVKCFLKDKKGFVWIGTFSGLNRFDGYSLKIFRNNQHDTSSLIDSEVKALFEDPNGMIWVDTWIGQCVYDPATEKFKRNTTGILSGFNIPQGKIIDIKKGKGDYYWFIHATAGLFKYVSKTKQTIKIESNTESPGRPPANELASIQEDVVGNLWMIYKNGILELMDVKNHKIIYRNNALYKRYSGQPFDYALLVDADGDVWILMGGANEGVYLLNNTEKLLQHIDKNSKPISINSTIVRSVVQDNKGLVWLATDHGGINLIDKKKGTVRYIIHNPEDERSLAMNSINVLYKDREGFIWAGTFKKGASYYHENMVRFRLISHQDSNNKSLPNNDINSTVEDDKGNLWIGTNGDGLVYYDREHESFKQFKNDPRNANSLSNNVIVSLCFSRDKKLWIGTYFGGLNAYSNERFTRYMHNPQDAGSLADNNVWEIFEGSQNRLWIGTLKSGVDLFDRAKNVFIHYSMGENSLHVAYVPCVAEDSGGNTWFGTGYGIDVLNKQTGVFTRFVSDAKQVQSLNNNTILSLLNDSYGNMWVGTKEGLNVYDKKTNTFKRFIDPTMPPHTSILAILEDNDHNVWMSTTNGISNLILHRGEANEITSFNFINYDESDGLQGKQFNEGAFCKTRAGELIFGGPNGLTIFKPGDVLVNELKPEIFISDFQIFNKSIQIGENFDGRVILPNAISHTTEITLKHSDNVFSLEFAALSFMHPEKNQYTYMLKGFNKDWLTTSGTNRRVTYTNLDPGNYTFIVKGSNNDGVWGEQGTSLRITILPPFWKTSTAFFIYTLAILGVLLLSRQLILGRERLMYKVEKERQEANQLHSLDVMKIKFLTNVSHEFRTPLTLILTPLEKIIKQTTEGDQKKQFQMIHRNARRLLNLVNQLLDLRRMDVQETKLNASEGDIISFIKDTAGSFSDLSEKNSIDFTISSSINSLETIFDKEKLEKIIFNLLSNAFKFTPEYGSVRVELKLVENTEKLKFLELKVIDTGIGIPAEKHEKIFERFFQSDLPSSMVNQGSGIGLSITYEFVKVHNGTLAVDSYPGKGSCFTVLLPVISLPLHPVDTFEVNEIISNGEDNSIHDAPVEKSNVPILLLVEDNEDFRFYLKDNLNAQYKVIEASNGIEGFDKAKQYLPDLIVSDVMMPEMNGIELCKKIKNNKNLSHIPIILLTARTSDEQRLEGFETGADDYITKPFSFEILQSRIKNLIHQREQFHKDFRKQIEVKASSIKITSLDEKLIQNAIKLVEDNISDPDFSVGNLSQELGMSRVHLYKKLLALTGKAPLEFIRTIRIQRAAQLLEKSQLTIAEVAYKVGFNNPKYFTKYFKDEFKMLPSTYVANKKQTNK